MGSEGDNEAIPRGNKGAIPSGDNVGGKMSDPRRAILGDEAVIPDERRSDA